MHHMDFSFGFADGGGTVSNCRGYYWENQSETHQTFVINLVVGIGDQGRGLIVMTSEISSRVKVLLITIQLIDGQ